MQQSEEGNVLFPIFVKLNELRTLLVGGGSVALEKLHALLSNSPEAKVRVVAPEVCADIEALAAEYPNIRVVRRIFLHNDLDHCDLVIGATNDAELHKEIKGLATERHILVNVADTPELCDFYLSSVVTKGDLKIAISTNGKSPTLAMRFRQYLQEAVPDGIQQSLDNLKSLRDRLKGDFDYKVKKLNEATNSWLDNNKEV